jgi:hypothetical protein
MTKGWLRVVTILGSVSSGIGDAGGCPVRQYQCWTDSCRYRRKAGDNLRQKTMPAEAVLDWVSHYGYLMIFFLLALRGKQ